MLCDKLDAGNCGNDFGGNLRLIMLHFWPEKENIFKVKKATSSFASVGSCFLIMFIVSKKPHYDALNLITSYNYPIKLRLFLYIGAGVQNHLDGFFKKQDEQVVVP